MRSSRVFFFIVVVCIILPHCKKDPVPVMPESDGIFTASLDGKFWQPIWYNAVYYAKMKMLFVSATDNQTGLDVGIYADSSFMLKQYPLEPNGTNAARLTDRYGRYISDHNSADAGGAFVLTKFDTINKKLSGKINFLAYTADGKKKVIFDNCQIDDIELKINDSADIDGSYVTVNVEGEKTTTWYSNTLRPVIVCIHNGKRQTMEFDIASPVSNGYGRMLAMQIPLDIGVGNFSVKPDVPPYSYCGGLDLTVRYNMGEEKMDYLPISGNFNITTMDTVARILKANFDFTVRDSITKKTIHFRNGQVILNAWYNLR
jgi:hypothetical protein